MHRLQFALAGLVLTSALLLSSPIMAAGMSEEIDHLPDFIAASPCAFIRNGVTYGGEQAAALVKDKYQHYRKDIDSAEDFIALAASKSMMSGRPYLVQCDSTTEPAADWLTKELAAFRRQP